MADDVRREVRNFIEDSFLYMHPDVELTDDEPLLARGLIDSLGFVELVEEVQARYGIQVAGRRDHRGELRLDRRRRRLRRPEAESGLERPDVRRGPQRPRDRRPRPHRPGHAGRASLVRGARSPRHGGRARPRARSGSSTGDRVATVYPNGVEAAVAIYGVLRAGAAFSPVNPSTKHDRLALQLADLGAAAVICDADRAETTRAAAADGGRGPGDLRPRSMAAARTRSRRGRRSRSTSAR